MDDLSAVYQQITGELAPALPIVNFSKRLFFHPRHFDMEETKAVNNKIYKMYDGFSCFVFMALVLCILPGSKTALIVLYVVQNSRCVRGSMALRQPTSLFLEDFKQRPLRSLV